METIIFKAPPGTREKLRGINRNVSALLRQGVAEIIQRKQDSSAHEKANHLCGIFKGAPRDLATRKDYRKQYGTKKPH
jgi:hypothetical protein